MFSLGDAKVMGRRDEIQRNYGGTADRIMAMLKESCPEKVPSQEKIFQSINGGDRIFVGTACGEPQYLIRALMDYVEHNPKAFFDTEVFHVWTLGVAPYTDEKYKQNFRHNTFFIGNSVRNAVNEGMADYTPIFLSDVPKLFEQKLVPIDVALVQTSPPDIHGYMSLGVSVDISKAAVENARVVIAQVNKNMPRVHGDGFVHVDDVDYLLFHDEPLLTFDSNAPDDIAARIGMYVSKIIQDGDTLQVGYGNIPNAILANLQGKKHLGIHSELLGDGIADLMKKGVIDNSKKTINRGKSIATFSMGQKETYDFIDDNPSVTFRTINYTNNPLIISQNRNMVAINSALEIDLTGQATAESLGGKFYSSIGGQANFMRGAVLSPGGRSILALQSTGSGGQASRIVPFLGEGVGVTLIRGDIHYVVTEYGIAYLHGKNIRERSMDLISIAHPKFRPWLIKEAKKLNIIFKDQAFIPGKRGEYPEFLETHRTTEKGLRLFLRPVRISDEPILKDFFYSLSDRSMYKRFISARRDMPHERLQDFVVIDYSRETIILAIMEAENREEVVGIGQYGISEDTHTAEVAFVVRDDYQKMGIGTELLSYLTLMAKKQGLLGFTAEVLADNSPMLRLFRKMGFNIESRGQEGVYELRMSFMDDIASEREN